MSKDKPLTCDVPKPLEVRHIHGGPNGGGRESSLGFAEADKDYGSLPNAENFLEYGIPQQEPQSQLVTLDMPFRAKYH